ncbi:MAG: hypothetical protein IPN76_10400 [Saprospiraceae bacterium]|nr:hypothetical protein [Saprospiraceae bacterium]
MGSISSGGLDSAIVTAAMRICGVSDIKTYTIGFEESPLGIDESNDAVEIARFYNTKHSAVKISNNFIEENFIDYVKALDRPSADGFKYIFG